MQQLERTNRKLKLVQPKQWGPDYKNQIKSSVALCDIKSNSELEHLNHSDCAAVGTTTANEMEIALEPESVSSITVEKRCN